jgi:hypothetical protein
LAQAAGLAILAREQLDENNTAALAYATASLELADRPETRRLALEALWRGPTFFSIPRQSPYAVDFSRDGRWLAAGGALFPSDGGEPVILAEAGDAWMEIAIAPRGDVVTMLMDDERFTLGIWSIPEGKLLRKLRFEDSLCFISRGTAAISSPLPTWLPSALSWRRCFESGLSMGVSPNSSPEWRGRGKV